MLPLPVLLLAVSVGASTGDGGAGPEDDSDRATAADDAPTIEVGKKIVVAVCSACHSRDGSRLVGSSLKGMWMRKGKDAKGREFVVDRAFLKQSILQPNARITAGYPAAMPPVRMSDAEIESVELYLKALDKKDEGQFGKAATGNAASDRAPNGKPPLRLRGKVPPDGGSPSVKAGEEIVMGICIACHTRDGSRAVGPSLKGMWMRKGKDAKGREFVVDRAFLKQSILEPGKRISAGYPPVMPPVRLTDEEIESVELYLKALDGASNPATGEPSHPRRSQAAP